MEGREGVSEDTESGEGAAVTAGLCTVHNIHTLPNDEPQWRGTGLALEKRASACVSIV